MPAYIQGHLITVVHNLIGYLNSPLHTILTRILVLSFRGLKCAEQSQRVAPMIIEHASCVLTGFWASIIMIELPLVPLVVDLRRQAAPSPIDRIPGPGYSFGNA